MVTLTTLAFSWHPTLLLSLEGAISRFGLITVTASEPFSFTVIDSNEGTTTAKTSHSVDCLPWWPSFSIAVHCITKQTNSHTKESIHSPLATSKKSVSVGFTLWNVIVPLSSLKLNGNYRCMVPSGHQLKGNGSNYRNISLDYSREHIIALCQWTWDCSVCLISSSVSLFLQLSQLNKFLFNLPNWAWSLVWVDMNIYTCALRAVEGNQSTSSDLVCPIELPKPLIGMKMSCPAAFKSTEPAAQKRGESLSF